MIETIGKRIRRLREEQDVSRARLARDAGIAVTTLSDLEIGRSHTTTALHRIAARLGVSADYLETGHGPRERGAAAPQPPLTADELELLASYRETAVSGRGVIRKQAAQVALLDPARGRRKP